MSIHIHRFVDRLRGLEARNVKDFTMSMNEAKDLHADITRLLNQLENLRSEAVVQDQDQVVTVQITGGTF